MSELGEPGTITYNENARTITSDIKSNDAEGQSPQFSDGNDHDSDWDSIDDIEPENIINKNAIVTHKNTGEGEDDLIVNDYNHRCCICQKCGIINSMRIIQTQNDFKCLCCQAIIPINADTFVSNKFRKTILNFWKCIKCAHMNDSNDGIKCGQCESIEMSAETWKCKLCYQPNSIGQVTCSICEWVYDPKFIVRWPDIGTRKSHFRDINPDNWNDIVDSAWHENDELKLHDNNVNDNINSVHEQKIQDNINAEERKLNEINASSMKKKEKNINDHLKKRKLDEIDAPTMRKKKRKIGDNVELDGLNKKYLSWITVDGNIILQDDYVKIKDTNYIGHITSIYNIADPNTFHKTTQFEAKLYISPQYCELNSEYQDVILGENELFSLNKSERFSVLKISGEAVVTHTVQALSTEQMNIFKDDNYFTRYVYDPKNKKIQ